MKTGGSFAVYTGAGWEMGIIRASAIMVEGVQVVGPQQGGIAAPVGATVDSEARSAVEEIFVALHSHGLIAS